MLLILTAAISSAWAQDTQPPTLPMDNSIITTAKTHNSISIKWNKATDNVTSPGLLQYNVKWEGTPSGESERITDFASYNITGLNPNTTYDITVEVYDVAGNKSTYPPTWETTLPAPTVPVTGVSLNKTATTIMVGNTETLVATVTPTTATNKAVTWSTSNAAVATVSGGTVTALASGTTTITVRTIDGGKTATCEVTVIDVPTIPATSVSISPTGTQYIEIGETTTLVATVLPSTATDKTVTWSSSDPAKAPVSSAGVVTGVGVGTFTITATTHNGLTASRTVQVLYDMYQPVVPTIDPVSYTKTHNSITVTWKHATDNKTPQNKLSYIILCFKTGWSEYSPPLVNTTTYTFTGLEADTEYTFEIEVSDEADNVAYYPKFKVRTEKNSGIDQTGIAALSAYPNPTNGMLTVTGFAPSGDTMRIYNALGTLVATYTVYGDKAEIDLSPLAVGMYFVSVNGKTVKIIRN